MRIVLTLVMGLALAGCTASTPTSPDPPVTPSPAPATAFLWAMVIEPSGLCIIGATIEVVSGERAGEILAQEPCDAWAPSGGVMLNRLTPGLQMTLRSSAPGYMPQTKTVVIHTGPQQALLFTPSRQ